MNPLAIFRWRREMPAARRDEKFELAQHLFHHARAPVIPVQNPLRRVTPADERQLGLGAIMFAELARDVDEQSLAGGRDQWGTARPAASSISIRCSMVAPEYSLWGNTRGTTQTT